MEAREVYYKLLSLPLLPAHHILDEFNKLKVIANGRHGAAMSAFVLYYEKQWMKKDHKGFRCSTSELVRKELLKRIMVF